jgi:hypothetical protein
MGAILDTLVLDPEELAIIHEEYPGCITIKLTNTDNMPHEYRLIIEDEQEDNYYNFLLNNNIAMSSHKFYSRIKSDKVFAAKVQSRIDDTATKLSEPTTLSNTDN